MTRARLARAVDRLPVRQRTALQLFAVEGWSYAQIADHLGSSIGTVKMLILRARQTLRETGIRTLAGVACGLRAVTRRMREAMERFALSYGPAWWDGGFFGVLRGAWGNVGAASLVVVAVAQVVAPLGGGPARADVVHRGAAAVVSSDQSPSSSAPPPAASENERQVSELVARSYAGDAERAAHHAVAPLAYRPASDPATEEAAMWSVAVSPSYEEDHTVFVAGNG